MLGAKAAEMGKSEGLSSLVLGHPDAVREELQRILESRHFRQSKQGQRFLQYIVEETLNGNAALLKERLLGAALFGRLPDYATGDDPVVRVQANEVRRRLEAYAAEHFGESHILIELPAGSYVPAIRPAKLPESPTSTTSTAERSANGNGFAVVREHDEAAPPSSRLRRQAPPIRRSRPSASPAVILIALGILLALVIAGYLWRSREAAAEAPERLAEAFWQPVLASPNPVVVSIGKVVVYRPSDQFFERYEQQHPGAFNTAVERLTRPLPLDANEPLRWGDLDQANNQGFSMGSMRSSMALSGFLAQHHKPFNVRLGVESSFAELRGAPAVMIGAFNNRWTLEMTSGLHFTYAETSGQPRIQEQTPSGRAWTWQRGTGQEVMQDYGLVTRLLAWKTGQAAISVGGLGHGGTTAATEMITNSSELAEVLKSLPKGWEQKNLQFVISADTTDGEAGRPTLVAYYVW